MHKSGVITGKDRCGVAKHFLAKCTNGSKVENNKVQLIEQLIMTLKVSCGEEKSIGKSNFLLYFTEWIVNGTSIVPIGKAIEKRNSYGLYYIFILCMLLVYILVLFEFLLPYSVA